MDKLFTARQIEALPTKAEIMMGPILISKRHDFLSALLGMDRYVSLYYAARENILCVCVEWYVEIGGGASPIEYYQLEPTATALALLEAPFTWKVSRRVSSRHHTIYKCRALIPATSTHAAYNVYAEVIMVKGMIITFRRNMHTLPTNLGPLRPLWQNIVKQWVQEVNNLNPKHVAAGMYPRLLKERFINGNNILKCIEW